MGGIVLPPSWLFGLRWPSPGVYELCGRVNGGLQEDSHQGASSRTAAANASILVVSPCWPMPPQETA